MKIFGDYHTHTIYSHGKGTIRDNVEAGIKMGLKELAICDHGPGHYLYGVKGDIQNIRDEVNKLNEEYSHKGIKILLGLEANLIGFDGKLDVDEKILNQIDLLLMGYHYGIMPNSIKDGIKFYIMNPLTKITKIRQGQMIEENTRAYIKALRNYPISFITHPGAKAKVDIQTLAKEAGKYNTALEINSKHSQLSVENIKIALEEDVEFIINSDAHSPEDVGNIDKGYRRAVEAKVPLDRIRNLRKN